MIISIDAEKAFDEIQHPFMTKTQKTRNKGKIFQHNKVIYEKPIANMVKTESFPPEIRNKTRMPTFTAAI